MLMKRLLTVLSILVFTMTALNAQNSEKMLKHVVLFKFKDSSTPSDIKKVEDALNTLATTNSENGNGQEKEAEA